MAVTLNGVGSSSEKKLFKETVDLLPFVSMYFFISLLMVNQSLAKQHGIC